MMKKIEEQAKELYERFSIKADSYIEGKRCALLCVEYLIKFDLYNRLNWELVKNEIENF